MSTASKIEYIALSGGGVRGVVYGGLVEALEETRLIQGVKGFSGTSAGSNISAFLAFGMSANDLKEKVLNVDLSQKLGKGYLGWFNDGKPMIDFINDLLINTIKTNIDNIDVNNIPNIDDKGKFEVFKKSLADEQNKPKITFGHLALLRKIKPEKFKDLYITTVSKQDKELKIFSSNTERDKDILVAEACRASSLPLLFSSADINEEKYLDGGLKNNIPYSAFVDKTHSIEPNKKVGNNSKEKQILSKTLVCTLEPGDRSVKDNLIYKVLHGKGTEQHIWELSIMERVIVFIMRALNLLHEGYINDVNKEYIELRKIPFNILNLNVKGLKTTDFHAADAMGEEKYFQGYFSTMEHLINYDKLSHLDEITCEMLVDQTRLQECFFKIITGANLNRSSTLYTDLMKYCGKTKFAKLNAADRNGDELNKGGPSEPAGGEGGRLRGRAGAPRSCDRRSGRRGVASCTTRAR